MLKDKIEYSLTFDDVLILPDHSKLFSSKASKKSRIPKTLRCNIPLRSLSMVKVNEHQTAIYMAQGMDLRIIYKDICFKGWVRHVNLHKKIQHMHLRKTMPLQFFVLKMPNYPINAK